MNRFLALGFLVAIGSSWSPARAEFIVPAGTQIFYDTDAGQTAVPLNIGGMGAAGTFTADYTCGSNVTDNSLNGGIIANQACINQLIKAGSGNAVEIAPNNSNASVEIGGGDNPTTIDSEGLSVGGSNLIKETSGTVEIGGASAVVEIGTGDNPTTISSEGVSVGGSNLIKKSGGTVSIGENSLKLREQGGRQQMWATDANGNSIDIDIVNSSDLLINGKSVQGQIDSNAANISTNAANISANAKNISNLGTGIAAATSLTAALSALPAASTNSPFSCGVGTGGYSDKFALGVGCAAKINQRLNANIAASHVFGGSVDYGEGSLDTVAARAGFVFKFGKIDASPKVAARKAAELRDEVAKLREENEAMRAESSMQQQINASLLARLERLERIASGQLSLLGDRASSD